MTTICKDCRFFDKYKTRCNAPGVRRRPMKGLKHDFVHGHVTYDFPEAKKLLKKLEELRAAETERLFKSSINTYFTTPDAIVRIASELEESRPHCRDVNNGNCPHYRGFWLFRGCP